MSLIESPLEWQKEMDNAPGFINMRGASRFWNTVSEKYYMPHFNMDGSPEFSRISFWLDRWKYVTFFLNKMPMDDDDKQKEQYIKYIVYESGNERDEDFEIQDYPLEKIVDKLSIFNGLSSKSKKIIFRLHQHIGLELSVEEDGVYINYRFVEIPHQSSQNLRIEFQYNEKQYWLGGVDEKYVNFETELEEKINKACEELDINKERIRVYTSLSYLEGKGWFVVADIWIPASQYFGTRKLPSNEDDM